MADPIHILAPDGSIVEFPAGTPDGVMTTAMQQAYPPPKSEHHDEGGVLKTADNFVRALANGATFGLADRFAAGMGALTGVGGKASDYAGNLEAQQGATEQFANEHPIANIAASAVGGVGLPLGALGAAAKGASLGGKVLYGAGAGAGIGGAYGLGGTKDLTDIPQAARDTAIGAGTGAVLGAALPVVAGGVGSVYNAAANYVKGAPGISKSALPHLVEAYKADTAPAIQAELDRLGPQATLADAGPALLGKAQGASLNSDEGRSVLQSALKDRDRATNQRIMGDVNKALGPAEDPQTVTNAIREHRANVDETAYTAALDNAPPVQIAPILRRVDALISGSVGNERKALTNVRDMLMTRERRPLLDAEGFPQYDSLGRERWQDLPVSQNNADVLHKVKQEIDNVIQYDAPGLGVPAAALTRQQGALKSVRAQLNNELETQVSGYRAANAQSAALARRAEAVDAGTQYLGSGKTTPFPERFAAEFDPLSQGEKIAFAKGSRGNIERILGTKANDLQALKSELQGEGGFNTAKLATVHGQDAADQLISSVDRNLKFRDTYNKVVENSQTAQRQAAAREMKPEPSSKTPFFNPNATISGQVGTATKAALGATLNALMKKDPTKAFGEIAQVLSAQGPKRDAYHAALVEALNRRATNAEASSKVGNAAAVTATAAAHGYLRGRSNVRSNSK